MKRFFLSAMALCAVAVAMADTIDVKRFIYAGPYPVRAPYMVDSVDVNSAPYDVKSMLDAPLSLALLDGGTPFEGGALPNTGEGNALHLLSFTVQAEEFAKVRLNISGITDYRLFVNGEGKSAGEITLLPSTNKFIIKYLSK